MKAEENRQGTRKWQIGIALSCILCCAFAIRTNETELPSLIACSVDFSMTVFFVFSPTLPAVSHFLRQFNEDDFRFHQRMSAKYFKFIHCNFYSGILRCSLFLVYIGVDERSSVSTTEFSSFDTDEENCHSHFSYFKIFLFLVCFAFLCALLCSAV